MEITAEDRQGLIPVLQTHVCEPGGALGIAQYQAGGGVCLFHCWGYFWMANPAGTGPGAAAVCENSLTRKVHCCTPSQRCFPPYCMFNTFKIAVINQLWQIRRDYAEIVGVGWVIIYFICTW